MIREFLLREILRAKTKPAVSIGTLFAQIGSNVTATPANPGEYRTYQKSSNSFAGTDNAPSVGPTAANGFRIYSVVYGNAGTSGQTNRWELYVGKNKSVRFQFYASAGRTGWICVDTINTGADTIWFGIDYSYDPTTGVVVVDAMTQATGTTNRPIGRSIGTGGAAYSSPSDCYFDVFVQDLII